MSQQRNRRYKELNRKFRTEKHNNLHLKHTGRLKSRREVTFQRSIEMIQAEQETENILKKLDLWILWDHNKRSNTRVHDV
jgi:hypothetical protein